MDRNVVCEEIVDPRGAIIDFGVEVVGISGFVDFFGFGVQCECIIFGYFEGYF